MAKTVVTFVCEEHEEYGSNGWRQVNQPDFDPLEGMAVAHDVMEHFPKGNDSTAHELMAFGACIFVRSDYYADKGRRYTRPSENFAGEIGNMLLKIEWGNVGAIEHCPFSVKVRGEHDANDEIDNAILELRKWLREERPEEKATLTTNEERDIRGWLAEGYRRAVRRYRGVRQYEVGETFREIEEAATKALQNAEIGDRLTVRLSKKRRMIIEGFDLVASIQHVSIYDEFTD